MFFTLCPLQQGFRLYLPVSIVCRPPYTGAFNSSIMAAKAVQGISAKLNWKRFLMRMIHIGPSPGVSTALRTGRCLALTFHYEGAWKKSLGYQHLPTFCSVEERQEVWT